jgi:hypothetical protein
MTLSRSALFLINHGYTPDEVRRLLRKTPKEMSFEMMTRLCKTFNCMPNDLFTWDGEATSHLNGLKRPEVAAFEKLIAGKTPEQIEAIHRRIQEGL